MLSDRALLMIPGPIEVSPAVRSALDATPPSHLAPDVIEVFGSALERMRPVWLASRDAQPFVVSGGGTIAMDMAVCNLIDPGDRVLLVNTGYFSDRMREMLGRRGARVDTLDAEPGASVAPETVAAALDAGDGEFKALFATHVDTSTGVCVDAEAYARAAAEQGVLSVFDGVCATAAERFDMEDWGADVYLTASQKAIGLPPGLALMLTTPRALAARKQLSVAPPLSLDWLAWLPIMRAYEAREASYFSTPATGLLDALGVSLREILDTEYHGQHGMGARFALHERAGRAMRAAWRALGLDLFCRPEVAANTLSAIRYPDGTGPELVAHIRDADVVVAGGLLPGHQSDYFRVGHMGWTVTQPRLLLETVEAIERGLAASGHPVERGAGVAAAEAELT